MSQTRLKSVDPKNFANASSDEKLNESAVHTFAHCMWWVAKGTDLPEDSAERDALWGDECYTWVRQARELLLHLEFNNFSVTRKV